jgi:hypothetical protein
MIFSILAPTSQIWSSADRRRMVDHAPLMPQRSRTLDVVGDSRGVPQLAVHHHAGTHMPAELEPRIPKIYAGAAFNTYSLQISSRRPDD